MKKPVSRWGMIFGVLVSCALIYYCATFRRHGANLLRHGKAEFFRSGFMYQDKYPLSVFDGRWHIGINANPHYADSGGAELLVPFRCYYNGANELEFDEGGKVYLVNKEDHTRTELRVIQGEWSYNVGDHWQDIFNLDGTLDLNNP
jgi:hypothetical protein